MPRCKLPAIYGSASHPFQARLKSRDAAANFRFSRVRFERAIFLKRAGFNAGSFNAALRKLADSGMKQMNRRLIRS